MCVQRISYLDVAGWTARVKGSCVGFALTRALIERQVGPPSTFNLELQVAS